MSEQQWAFREPLQPKPDETQFDLDRAFDAMVLISAEVPADGYTAANLGTERGGYGAVIRDDGLILTIGYLITEASSVWITANSGASSMRATSRRDAPNRPTTAVPTSTPTHDRVNRHCPVRTARRVGAGDGIDDRDRRMAAA